MKKVQGKIIRAAICGPSGAGKSTISKFISEELNIPYIHTNGPELREKYNWKTHADIVVNSAKDPERGLLYQLDLLSSRVKLAEAHKETGFIMDRSPIDNIAYFLLQGTPVLPQLISDSFIKRAIKSLDDFTHIIFIRPLYEMPEDDGVRIMNSHYQYMSAAVMEYVISHVVPPNIFEENLDVLVIDFWDLEKRKKAITSFFEKTGYIY